MRHCIKNKTNLCLASTMSFLFPIWRQAKKVSFVVIYAIIAHFRLRAQLRCQCRTSFSRQDIHQTAIKSLNLNCIPSIFNKWTYENVNKWKRFTGKVTEWSNCVIIIEVVILTTMQSFAFYTWKQPKWWKWKTLAVKSVSGQMREEKLIQKNLIASFVQLSV